MDHFSHFPDVEINASGIISSTFRDLGIDRFHAACRYVQQLPYGYNSNREDLGILFKEKKGSCTTKHAVIATLAAESDLPIVKNIGIYAMTETIVSGTQAILARYDLPYIPMIHCFLVYHTHRVDLTEGNQNGKNRSIDDFLHTEPVVPNISAKDEYRLYRKALSERILHRPELSGVALKTVLHAREKGLVVLKANI